MANLQKVARLFYNRSGQLNKEQVTEACNILNQSGVIALPTDTLYGIAAKVSDSKALDRIYKIKGRDQTKPLAVCIANAELIEEVADIGQTSINVFKSLLPGPITFVLNRSKSLNKDLNPNIGTVGVRVPDHNFIIAICCEVGPLALTSANKSGQESPIEAEDFADIWDELDRVYDVGPTRRVVLTGDKDEDFVARQRAGSTVIDMTDPTDKFYKIIREGCVLNRVVSTLMRLGYRRSY